jgi:hypothetical protein
MINTTKYFTKKLFKEFYGINIKLPLIIAVFSFYSAYSLSILEGSGCSVFEYALLGMSDHYYMVFFFLIIYFVALAKTIKGSDALSIIRAGRYFSYYTGKLAAIALFTASLVFLHAAIIMAIGSARHGWGNDFTNALGSIVSVSEIIMQYRGSFQTPLAAFICMCIYLTMGLSACSGVLMLIAHRFSERAVILAAAGAYLLITVTLHFNIDKSAPFLFVNNYLFLHRAIYYGAPLGFAAVSALAVSVSTLLANRQRRQVARRLAGWVSPLRTFGEALSFRNIAVLLGVSLVLAILSAIKNMPEAASGIEHAIMVFWGYGLGYFNAIDFLQLIILNGMPIYILSAYFGNKMSMRGMVMIRYGHKRRWFASLQASMAKLIAFLLIATSIFCFLIGALYLAFGDSGGGGDMLAGVGSPLGALLIGLSLRIFEIMFMQMFFLVVHSFAKSVSVSFLTTMAMYLSVIVLNYRFVPFGLSSLCRALEIGSQGLLANALLAAAIFAVPYAAMYVYMGLGGAGRLLNERK